MRLTTADIKLVAGKQLDIGLNSRVAFKIQKL